jgi:hypothetical protein
MMFLEPVLAPKLSSSLVMTLFILKFMEIKTKIVLNEKHKRKMVREG